MDHDHQEERAEAKSPESDPELPGSAVVAVLAGGRARRLGGAKATVLLDGRPLITYPLEAAARAGLDAMVVAKADSPLPDAEAPFMVDAEVILEPEIPRHPLAGVLAALRRAEGRPVVALACDLPLAGPELLGWLAGRPERLVVPSTGGRLQPLLALYRPELAPELEAGLEASLPMQQILASLDPRIVGDRELAAFGDPDRMFVNINEPGDLERLEAVLRSS